MDWRCEWLFCFWSLKLGDEMLIAKARRNAKVAKEEGMDVFDFRERMNSGVDPSTEDLAQRVIGAAIEVHRHLGPGHPEIAYKNAMAYELELRGITCEMEVPISVIYKGKVVALGRIDMLVERTLILELKAVEAIADVHKAQAAGYLAAMSLQLALVMNFNVAVLKSGIKRVVRTH
jgi:GxxExxY protein